MWNVRCLTTDISHSTCSGGSRISRRGGVDLRRGHFLVKMYAKMKELGPIGGRALGMPPPLDPPMHMHMQGPSSITARNSVELGSFRYYFFCLYLTFGECCESVL